MSQQLTEKTIKNSTYVSFIIICMGYLFALVPRFALAVNADKIAQDFSLAPAALGVLTSAYFCTYAITQAPSGLLADKLAPEVLIIVSLAGVTFANVLFTFANSLPVAIISRFITGLTGSLVYVPALRFTASNFPATKFSFFSSLLVSINGLCVIMVNGPLVILSEKYGWRSVFALSAAICFISAAILLVVYRVNKEDTKHKAHASDEGRSVFQEIKEVFNNKLAWPMFVRIFLSYGVTTSFQSLWSGPYMMGVLGMSRAATGKALALMSLATLIASPIGGYLADNVIKTRRLMVSWGLVWSALCWLPLVIFVDTISPFMLTLDLCAMAFGAGLGSGAQLAQVKEVYPPEVVGAAMGVNNTFLILGGAVLPTIFGFVIGSEITNPAKQFSNAFLLNVVCVAMAAIASFASVETYGRTYEEIVGTFDGTNNRKSGLETTE